MGWRRASTCFPEVKCAGTKNGDCEWRGADFRDDKEAQSIGLDQICPGGGFLNPAHRQFRSGPGESDFAPRQRSIRARQMQRRLVRILAEFEKRSRARNRRQGQLTD